MFHTVQMCAACGGTFPAPWCNVYAQIKGFVFIPHHGGINYQKVGGFPPPPLICEFITCRLPHAAMG